MLAMTMMMVASNLIQIVAVGVQNTELGRFSHGLDVVQRLRYAQK